MGLSWIVRAPRLDRVQHKHACFSVATERATPANSCKLATTKPSALGIPRAEPKGFDHSFGHKRQK
jgi:hypothetical protein